ncbi:EAL domain-containing protein [Shewanella sp. Isolate8]|uniref:EAL domain-containing protein n=1 Tax=Shewanella sp. Isolate8 TaxID=2908529 RepID=UPI001EFEE171|nr:EAL domain-containing protein [Shewanella sp. Isolate8]MCG9745460.1 EAL domain-containing protein [Shewanella sp. Isolate8]
MKGCQQCSKNVALDFDFTMAFQPIVDIANQKVFGYEALVRGPNDEAAYSVISRVNDDNRYAFDQSCRVKAIALAAKLNLESILSINFLPNAIYQPERCIRTTLAAAREYGFPTERIMFEFTESEKITDSGHVKRVVEYYRELGFMTAIDDFGAGYAGLGLLANFQTDLIKLDMELIRNIDRDETRQVIVTHLLGICHQLKIRCLAEGIETPGEMRWLKGAGVALMQGYLFAKPGFECLPEVAFP